ncbi:MAG: HAMP domain-containing protein [Deltaproteobacteria bacterium]|nr:HAMP domain-containing protein [Deltaproteobacteria bacterium]
MKFRFSISIKLLLLILPLVCLPIATVGYFSYRASVERVNRLVRQEQMAKVRATAARIDDIFYTCRLDLNTISSLPVLNDYHLARSFRLNAEAEFSRDSIVRLFRDFIERAHSYFQIRFIDPSGVERIKVRSSGETGPLLETAQDAFFEGVRGSGSDGIQVSEITFSGARHGYLMHWARPIFTAWDEFVGIVVIDVDYEAIREIVRSIQVGEEGYAFLVDGEGRTIAHPQFGPYEHGLGNYPDPSIAGLVHEMNRGGSGWKSYRYEGADKLAAFWPIPGMGWSLAATIPSSEFTKEVGLIRTRVLQVVLLILFCSIVGVSLLSYYMLKPVRDLVSATHRIAGGDLSQEIPVRSRDELGDLTSAFNRMVRNLARIQDELVRSEKLISLGRLSAGVAHEIRNPLNAMKGAVVLLRRRRAGDALIQEYTGLVSEEIDRLNAFVTDFLTFARQSAPKRVPTDVNRIILSAQDLFEEQARERRIVFHNNLDPDMPPLLVDPHQMEQVVINLMVNAMDAMPEGGEIRFSTGLSREGVPPESPARAKIVIRDLGVGIPRSDLKSVFDPFFSTKDAGTGLGLPLSLGIVESHGGTVRIESRKGWGTRLTIQWPAAYGDQGPRETGAAGTDPGGEA